MITHVNGRAHDESRHHPQPSSVIVLAVELSRGVQAQGLERVGRAFRDIPAEEALGSACTVQLEERLGEALVLWWFAVEVEGEHDDTEDGEEEGEPDEVCFGQVFPAIFILMKR